MTGHHRTPVTVVGLGSMGSALAEAFVDAGHAVTVWNRTPSKAAPLVAKGAVHARSTDEAVAASGLVITCLTTYDDTLAALGPAAAALDGRALVTLNSGSPAGAREMAAWADGQGARYLDGAIKNLPSAVGAESTLLYYSGDRSVFDEFTPTLRVMGGDTVYLGADPDLSALYEMAVGGTLLPSLVGFFQGAAALQAKTGRIELTISNHLTLNRTMEAASRPRAQEIDSGDYSDPASSVNLFLAGSAHDEELGKEANLDAEWHKGFHDLLRRAVDAGHGEHSISALTEVLRTPDRAA
ncbi:NAD(P)-binding domain-containing protein [Streptomyces globisporus]|uniref:NAD(P)-dependent oxidoreductase n=1 Tax=Streptomyces globisporus TaxID=1908 RepID=UPI00345F6ABE